MKEANNGSYSDLLATCEKGAEHDLKISGVNYKTSRKEMERGMIKEKIESLKGDLLEHDKHDAEVIFITNKILKELEDDSTLCFYADLNCIMSYIDANGIHNFDESKTEALEYLLGQECVHYDKTMNIYFRQVDCTSECTFSASDDSNNWSIFGTWLSVSEREAILIHNRKSIELGIYGGIYKQDRNGVMTPIKTEEQNEQE
jgi:hypothetical protein